MDIPEVFSQLTHIQSPQHALSTLGTVGHRYLCCAMPQALQCSPGALLGVHNVNHMLPQRLNHFLNRRTTQLVVYMSVLQAIIHVWHTVLAVSSACVKNSNSTLCKMLCLSSPLQDPNTAPSTCIIYTKTYYTLLNTLPMSPTAVTAIVHAATVNMFLTHTLLGC